MRVFVTGGSGLVGGRLIRSLVRAGADVGLTVAMMADECTIDDSKARDDLGYRSQVTRAAGMAELRGAAV